MLVDDQDERCWLGDHRVVADFAHPDELALDERLLTACWAWEQIELHSPVVGVHHTELRLDGELRRTVVPYTTTEKRNAAARLGARGAGDARPVGLVGPDARRGRTARGAPSARRASRWNRGDDVSSLLAERYRERPAGRARGGRLGGTSWGMGRGAAPPRLGRRDDP